MMVQEYTINIINIYYYSIYILVTNITNYGHAGS